jgi:hypothetical protein
VPSQPLSRQPLETQTNNSEPRDATENVRRHASSTKGKDTPSRTTDIATTAADEEENSTIKSLEVSTPRHICRLLSARDVEFLLLCRAYCFRSHISMQVLSAEVTPPQITSSLQLSHTNVRQPIPRRAGTGASLYTDMASPALMEGACDSQHM